MSANNSQQSQIQTNSQESERSNSSQSDTDAIRARATPEPRPYRPSGHDDTYSPRTQAWRDTPPSSQQYSGWSREERTLYRDHVVRNATRSLETEIEVRRDSENWWRECYNTVLMNSSRDRQAHEIVRPVRVAAVYNTFELGSQGSSRSRSSQRSWSPDSSQYRESQERRYDSQD